MRTENKKLIEVRIRTNLPFCFLFQFCWVQFIWKYQACHVKSLFLSTFLPTVCRFMKTPPAVMGGPVHYAEISFMFHFLSASLLQDNFLSDPNWLILMTGRSNRVVFLFNISTFNQSTQSMIEFGKRWESGEVLTTKISIYSLAWPPLHFCLIYNIGPAGPSPGPTNNTYSSQSLNFNFQTRFSGHPL